MDPTGFPLVVLPNRPRMFSGVGVGWSRLLVDLIDRLDAIAPGWQVVDVSQKWGWLRFLYDPASIPAEARHEFRRAVEEAKEASKHICDICGGPGETVGPLTVRTRCPRHLRPRGGESDGPLWIREPDGTESLYDPMTTHDQR